MMLQGCTFLSSSPFFSFLPLLYSKRAFASDVTYPWVRWKSTIIQERETLIQPIRANDAVTVTRNIRDGVTEWTSCGRKVMYWCCRWAQERQTAIYSEVRSALMAVDNREVAEWTIRIQLGCTIPYVEDGSKWSSIRNVTRL